MNSYFEQSGFYGHPHQTSGMSMTSAAHHDQSATAAYRGFPLSLGMTPYANHHLHQSRSTQDSPYDASITAACTKLYDGTYNKDCAKTGSSETNGYKDVWNTSGGSNTQNNSTPVRPSACTPDSRVGGYLDTANGSPVGRSGNGSSSGVSASAWNSTQCGITGASGQVAAAAASGLHQASNHTFYPWMAIAGTYIPNHTLPFRHLQFLVVISLWFKNGNSTFKTQIQIFFVSSEKFFFVSIIKINLWKKFTCLECNCFANIFIIFLIDAI